MFIPFVTPFLLYRRRNTTEGIDLNSEYALIQQKKSKLPAATRAAIVAQVERNRMVRGKK